MPIFIWIKFNLVHVVLFVLLHLLDLALKGLHLGRERVLNLALTRIFDPLDSNACGSDY